MSRFLPRSLFGQTLLILLVGLVVSHTVGAWIYAGAREQAVRAIGGYAAAQRVANLSRLVEEAPPDWRPRIVQALNDPTFRVALSAQPPELPPTDAEGAAKAVEDYVRQQLPERSDRQVRAAVLEPNDRPPGAPFGPLARIASGGELSRFILALKVALAAEGGATTMIFDEIDRGVGGAVASAIGERLWRLAQSAQVLVVTHSPQVAARGAQHLLIAKAHDGVVTRTGVVSLDEAARREEIARMLSGATVTDEARAQAERLLEAA